MLKRMKSRNDAVVEMPTMTPPDGASYISPITLREALATPGVMAKLGALGLWWPNTRLARALARYGNRDGDLLAGGMALTILVSLTAALTVALTIFMAVLGNYPGLRTSVVESIDTVLPGVLTTPDKPGMINPDDLVRTDVVNMTNIIALLIATWTGLGVVGKMGRSIRTMFGVVILPESFLKTQARNILGGLALLISILLGSGIGFFIDIFGYRILDWLSLDSSLWSQLLLNLTAYGLPFGIHILVSWILIRLVAGIRPPKRDLVWGVILMAAIALLLRVLGTGVVASVKGPILAAAATLVTLILWINIQMRVTLMVSAWIANPPRAIPVTSPEETRFLETPNYVTMSEPHTLEWPRHEYTGEIAPAPKAPELPDNFEPYFDPKPRRTFLRWFFGAPEKRR